MSETTDRYALSLLHVAQAQKEITHNDALAHIDALLHLAVETATLVTPPPAPVAGKAWIIAPGATGVWQGRDRTVASFGSGGWRHIVPQQGCVAWLRDLQRFAVFTADGWRDDAGPFSGIPLGSRQIFTATPGVVTDTADGTIVDRELRATMQELLTMLRDQGIVG